MSDTSNKTPQTFAEITQSQIDGWKALKPLFLVSVPIDLDDPDSEDANFYIQAISNDHQRMVNAAAREKGVDGTEKAAMILLKCAVKGGDMKYIADDYIDSRIRNHVLQEIGELVAEKKTVRKRV